MGTLIPIVILIIVFLIIVFLIIVSLLIALRKVGNINFRIWQVMLLGAGAVLVTGAITPEDALASISLDVMLFLFFMFVIGEALAASGYLYHLSYRLFSRAGSVRHLVVLILVGAGVFSTLLMNDTLAIVGTPLMIQFARIGVPLTITQTAVYMLFLSLLPA